MSLPHVVGLALKLGHVVLMVCCWIIPVIPMNWLANGGMMMDTGKPDLLGDGGKVLLSLWEKISGNSVKIQNLYYEYIGSRRVRNTWGKRLLVAWIVFWVCVSSWAFWYMSSQANEKRKETLASMCDERSRMLQDQFNVSMNHVQAMSIFISTFHHAKNPSAIDQETFARYTERTAFERPLTSGVAYAVRVLHSEREQFEKQQGWKIKRMDTLKETPLHKDEYSLEPLPAEDEYAPVIFAQDTVAHVISLDLMSGKEDRENVLRARESGKGVLTAPFPLLKTNRLGVILTFAVYNMDLPSNATPNERVQATLGYLGGIFDIESLVEKLLHQLASKQTIMVNVYDMTNLSNPISMYGCDETGDELQYVSPLSFGDPFRRHEMRCRLKQKPPWPWLAIATAGGILVIALLTGHIFHATVNRIARVEDDCRKMEKLKRRAEAADVAKSQFLATVSHEIRTPMNGVLGMLHMLMDTDLDVTQQDYVRTAQASGKALVSLINEVLDQAKIEANKIELEAVTFDLREILDDVLSLFSGKSQEKGVELAVYISDRVPELVVGDPGRFRQIITNLMGNSVKFTEKGHIFATVHLVEELKESIDVETDSSSKNTLSGLAVADKRRSWAGFRAFFSEDGVNRTSPSELVNVVVSVEDTGVGIPLEAHSRMFTPFMQVGPSISRTHGGTGIGLSISKYLVGLMNGEIGFSSVPKVGSTFTFTAALGKGSCNLDEQKKRQSGSATCELRGMTALVVDPRPVRAKVARYHIQRLGIGVEVAPDLITSSVCGGGGGGGSCSTNTNMVLVEQEVWDKDVSSSASFVNRLKTIASGTAPKLFVLTNSMCWSDIACGADTPTVIMKPLRASMLAASLQRALGVPSKGGSSCSTKLSSLSLRKLLRGRKILVVDDNNVNLRVAAGALKKYGADVVCVDGGKKAISLLTPPHCFDACFMDIQMPEMDGFEATKRIREMERERIHNYNGSASGERWHVPILAMTADVIQATHEQCVKCEMDGYVSKPFEAEQLYREASRFFETKSD